ncbi:Putative uncharacterized protein [Taphrina deformans PYCC 5710]|uniref:Uncharacterized protein n=1 Tax=Taphrina deformans (strain PYCC 5710 / ATCC 11124 / CBS 356.35 / IMI 108563 / JCM 9778 / NBRC 8474) TaxID=1097556 RepID=R4XGF1_TAPDE|nr:Putative uncharacterized protein [Taphrina deformans PYCC 5710]|eukprot:CCG83564.1 Putative uncharacterized protein [Taphrina deformans PYCC 5710]
MSEKEAKLAAARKRAEALKAKKAQKNESEKAEDGTKDAPEPVVEGTTNEEETHSTEFKPDVEKFEKEIESLRGLLKESTSQQEDLRKKLEEAASSSKVTEQEWKSRVKELEDSLTRREEHVHTLELDISKLRKQHEEQQTASSAAQKKIEELEKETTNLKQLAEQTTDLEADSLRMELQAAHSALDDMKSTQAKLETVEAEAAQLRSEADEARQAQSSHTEKQQSRAVESETKTKTLLAENQSLLSQLTELRSHLISVQDEKFALGETIERLQKAAKDAKMNKTGYRTSSDVPRARLSKDFERPEVLQEVSLSSEPRSLPQRNPKEPPADLQNNISIDLTSWYDKNAGEVIEV